MAPFGQGVATPMPQSVDTIAGVGWAQKKNDDEIKKKLRK